MHISTRVQTRTARDLSTLTLEELQDVSRAVEPQAPLVTWHDTKPTRLRTSDNSSNTNNPMCTC